MINLRKIHSQPLSLKLYLLILLSLCLFLFIGTIEPSQAGANTNKTKWDHWHKVTHVVDGDTVRAMIDGKDESIRIIGINAPEKHWTECYGAESNAKAKEFLDGKWIKLEKDESQGTRDKYGRQLAYVWFDSGTDFGRRMIEEGYAFEYTYSKPYNKQSQYKETQAESKLNKHGLWAANTCNGKMQKIATSGVKPTPTPAPAPAPRRAPAPKPRPTPAPRPASNCDPNYTPCVQKVSYDLDCGDIRFSVRVIGSDTHRFDRDGDGYGCESY